VPPTSGARWGQLEVGRGHSQNSWAELAREIFHTIMSCSAMKPGAAGRGGGVFDKVAVGQRLGRYWSACGE